MFKLLLLAVVVSLSHRINVGQSSGKKTLYIKSHICVSMRKQHRRPSHGHKRKRSRVICRKFGPIVRAKPFVPRAEDHVCFLRLWLLSCLDTRLVTFEAIACLSLRPRRPVRFIYCVKLRSCMMSMAYEEASDRVSRCVSHKRAITMVYICGSETNTLDREKRWVEEALEATAPGLIDRLGGDVGIVDSHEGVGNVSGYLCQR